MDWTQRYSTHLSQVFSNKVVLDYQLRVEVEWIHALEDLGIAPKGAYDNLLEASKRVTVERVLQIESETHHDIMAIVKALTEQSPEYGGWVHYGLTSQDINDTVLPMQLTDCSNAIREEAKSVKFHLRRLTEQHRDLVCIARTHGQHAIPTTVGFKFANYLYELQKAVGYLDRPCPQDTGMLTKLAGAVGTCASVEGNTGIRDLALKYLEMNPETITTQVKSRIDIAGYAFALCQIASVLERLAKEIRNLQRTEIGELFEGFSADQVGSSTMPQKRNPHKSERITGIARVIRSQLPAIMETTALEHERDLTNSSVERITMQTVSSLTHYILCEMSKILTNLQVDTEAVSRNLDMGQGKQLTERIMMYMTNRGMSRQVSHEILKEAANQPNNMFRSHITNRLKEMFVIGEKSVVSVPEEIDYLFDPSTYTGAAQELIDRVLNGNENIR